VTEPLRTPVRPVRRRVVLASLVVVIGLLVLAIEATDRLRHPPSGLEAPIAEVDADPRIPVECPTPDVERPTEPTLGPRRPVAEVASNDLYDCPSAWDRRPVRYTGEVVGAVLRRGEHAWVQLNDDVYALGAGPLRAHRDYQGGNAGIGVRIPAAVADEIRWVGSGLARGDVIEVRGVFRRVHRPTREPAVIIAETAVIVRSGEPFTDPLLPDRLVAAGVLGVLAVGLVIVERVVARRRRA
jgi:hypothetical protein